MISFWEKKSFTNYDLIVIGGGLTGMFCALSYINKKPKSKVLILERGIFPSGASTKNAGFATFGSLSEIISDNKTLSDNSVFNLVEKRVLGLELLKKTIPKSNLNIKNHGGYELIFKSNFDLEMFIEKYNKLLYPIFNDNIFYEAKQKIKLFGFSKTKLTNLIFNPYESQIDPGETVFALQRILLSKGVNIINGANVKEFNSSGNTFDIITKSDNEIIKFKSTFMAICSNAFAKKWFPKEDINPGRGMIIITKPLKKLKFKGSFHYNEGFNYFRDFKKRVIIGGGRNLDFKSEATSQFGINNFIKKSLINDLHNIILQNEEFAIDMEWSGIMAFGSSKEPIIKKLSDRSVLAVRLGGIGVSISSTLGKEASELLL
ncbi:MAG: FAD-dependent oxidoreductase [Flavobacteriales bacterium]|nr:FAD-dependent oxidoreductase [Flavobacteriales bacterium]